MSRRNASALLANEKRRWNLFFKNTYTRIVKFFKKTQTLYVSEKAQSTRDTAINWQGKTYHLNLARIFIKFYDRIDKDQESQVEGGSCHKIKAINLNLSSEQKAAKLHQLISFALSLAKDFNATATIENNLNTKWAEFIEKRKSVNFFGEGAVLNLSDEDRQTVLSLSARFAQLYALSKSSDKAIVRAQINEAKLEGLTAIATQQNIKQLVKELAWYEAQKDFVKQWQGKSKKDKEPQETSEGVVGINTTPGDQVQQQTTDTIALESEEPNTYKDIDSFRKEKEIASDTENTAPKADELTLSEKGVAYRDLCQVYLQLEENKKQLQLKKSGREIKVKGINEVNGELEKIGKTMQEISEQINSLAEKILSQDFLKFDPTDTKEFSSELLALRNQEAYKNKLRHQGDIDQTIRIYIDYNGDDPDILKKIDDLKNLLSHFGIDARSHRDFINTEQEALFQALSQHIIMVGHEGLTNEIVAERKAYYESHGHGPDPLVPVVLKGEFPKVIPRCLWQNIVITLSSNAEDEDRETFYKEALSAASPLGLIPTLLNIGLSDDPYIKTLREKYNAYYDNYRQLQDAPTRFQQNSQAAQQAAKAQAQQRKEARYDKERFQVPDAFFGKNSKNFADAYAIQSLINKVEVANNAINEKSDQQLAIALYKAIQLQDALKRACLSSLAKGDIERNYDKMEEDEKSRITAMLELNEELKMYIEALREKLETTPTQTDTSNTAEETAHFDSNITDPRQALSNKFKQQFEALAANPMEDYLLGTSSENNEATETLKIDSTLFGKPNKPFIFLSYAWPRDPKKLEQLQAFLLKLHDEMESLGIGLFLDIVDMKKNIDITEMTALSQATHVITIDIEDSVNRLESSGFNNFKREQDLIRIKKTMDPDAKFITLSLDENPSAQSFENFYKADGEFKASASEQISYDKKHWHNDPDSEAAKKAFDDFCYNDTNGLVKKVLRTTDEDMGEKPHPRQAAVKTLFNNTIAQAKVEQYQQETKPIVDLIREKIRKAKLEKTPKEKGESESAWRRRYLESFEEELRTWRKDQLSTVTDEIIAKIQVLDNIKLENSYPEFYKAYLSLAISLELPTENKPNEVDQKWNHFVKKLLHFESDYQKNTGTTLSGKLPWISTFKSRNNEKTLKNLAEQYAKKNAWRQGLTKEEQNEVINQVKNEHSFNDTEKAIEKIETDCLADNRNILKYTPSNKEKGEIDWSAIYSEKLNQFRSHLVAYLKNKGVNPDQDFKKLKKPLKANKQVYYASLAIGLIDAFNAHKDRNDNQPDDKDYEALFKMLDNIRAQNKATIHIWNAGTLDRVFNTAFNEMLGVNWTIAETGCNAALRTPLQSIEEKYFKAHQSALSFLARSSNNNMSTVKSGGYKQKSTTLNGDIAVINYMGKDKKQRYAYKNLELHRCKHLLFGKPPAQSADSALNNINTPAA